MMEAFKNRKIKKRYLAFVQGALAKNSGEIKNRIENLSAHTKYKALERKKDFTVVEVTPLTGRTNQIRIHFKQLGHPVVGERKFAFRRDFSLRAKRLCLHAEGLEFFHPVTGKQLCLRAELPQDLKDFLKNHA